jgi:protein tyrosine/serine phosphatase
MENIHDAHEIMPGLWLGNRHAAANVEWLRAHGIRAVFNCTKDIPFATDATHNYRLPVDDNLAPAEIRNMRTWAPEAVLKLVREWRAGPVLVHCAAGMQRSAALVAMLLVTTTGKPLNEVMMYIRSKRPIAFFPRANFFTALTDFESAWMRARSP